MIHPDVEDHRMLGVCVKIWHQTVENAIREQSNETRARLWRDHTLKKIAESMEEVDKIRRDAEGKYGRP